MSENKLTLQDQALFQFIYSENLYIIDTQKSEPKAEVVLESTRPLAAAPVGRSLSTAEIKVKEKSIIKPKYSGQNKKEVLILCQNDLVIKNPALKDLLFKILNAVGLQEDDVALSYIQTGFKVTDFLSHIPFKKAILFGIDPQLAELPAKMNILSVTGEKSYLFNDGLESISSDVSRKKLLWENLKKMFNI